ncbi:TerB family tellurite resistance protein [Bernardetia sp.]|uniref:tellurite resistance TerB family protein n=1 Tax=Bernardetia sp. TaxID=1937974 RepID=UPI0025BD5C75|nr:TerB family tellurite resistance protein [Bernardetia sp.]
MKNKEFKKVLFKAAFSVMACDGEVAESELLEIKEMLKNTLYFEGLNYEEELQVALEDLKGNGLQSIESFFNVLKGADLSELQELQLLEVLIRMIHADDKVDENELIFMHRVRRSLSVLSDAKIMVRFPKNINLLLNLSKYNAKPFHSNLGTMNLKAFDDINFTD